MIIIKNYANRKIIVDNCAWRNCVLYKLRLFIFLACLPIIMFVGYISYLYIEEAIDKRIERKRINKINDNRQTRSIK